ncbi:MAG: sigma-70 region 4 domain-containing protein [Planctomycetota bacterium]|nr:sigma-70 region 4 domain-containing protein [Planctomycetota bacterium]
MIAASRISSSQAFSRKQKEFQVQILISQMPQEAQEVLRFRFVEGLPTKEIATQMQKSDAAVRVLLRRKGKKSQTEIGLENLTR